MEREYVDGAWKPREDRIDWVRAIQRRCDEADVPFFFKQWGGNTSKAAGREFDGEVWDEFPGVSLERLRASGE